jgi:integral membrane protein
MKNPVHFLRITALIEAVSFLVLLGIAMPLKYVWGFPLAVKIVGSIHGGLFVVFGIALLLSWQSAKWPLSRVALIFIASFLPVVPFFLDKRIKSWEQESV